MGQDTFKEVKIITFPDMIVRVHIPDLTPEERARRMKIIHNSAAALLREQEQKKLEKRMNT